MFSTSIRSVRSTASKRVQTSALATIVSTPEGESFEYVADRAQPQQIQTVAVNIEGQKVSSDGTDTLFPQIEGDGWPVASVAKNDGSGKCTLNTELLAETYGSRFTTDGKRVIWIEYGSGGSEAGWSADPATCQSKVKFGDWVLGYAVSGDFVMFEGGDEADSTSYLQYARLPSDPAVTEVTPLSSCTRAPAIPSSRWNTTVVPTSCTRWVERRPRSRDCSFTVRSRTSSGSRVGLVARGAAEESGDVRGRVRQTPAHTAVEHQVV